jgi:hypothetical protein
LSINQIDYSRSFVAADDDGSVIVQSVGSVSDPAPANVAHLSDHVVGDDTSDLSLWLQWTLPQVTAALIAPSQSAASKLLLEMEDCQSSFDWTPLYFQAKYAVIDENILIRDHGLGQG